MSNTHIFIPDPHAHPDFNNDRFDLLAQLIIDVQPDHVICAGDFFDMPSLCDYEKGLRAFEGRRYKADIEVGHEALERIKDPIWKRKKKLPKFWMLHGNHEQRVEKAIERNPSQLEGILSMDDFQFSEYGWEVIPYAGSSPGYLFLDGIAYTHFATSGILGRPISSLHLGYNLINKKHMSTTVGHSHLFSQHTTTDGGGRRLWGLSGGCFIDYYCPWAGDANEMWWRGVVIKHSVKDGEYDPEFISLKRLENLYGY